MKDFTAKEARDMANNTGVATRETRSILRNIKRVAKRGRYSLSISYSEWDSVVAERICENLRNLGYRADTDLWRAVIYVSWK
jgi:hypothetical protein